jgi:hypothetical protein
MVLLPYHHQVRLITYLKCKKAEPDFKKYIQSFLLKIDEIHFDHITSLLEKEEEILPLYMLRLSSNEHKNYLNVCQISFDFNEENLYHK